MEDIINKPDHYCVKGLPEAIEIIEGLGLNFRMGNVLKYVYRAGRKNKQELQDLKKARWYLDREIKALEKWLDE